MTWLTIMEYLCHKWPRICSTCRKHFPVLSSFTTYYRVCNHINTTGATSGAGTANPSGAHEFTPGFSGVRVTRSLVLYVCFVDRCLSFCTFSFGHCVVCSSSIYGFWLRLWYLQALLKVRIYWPDKVIWTEDLVQVQNMCYTFLMYNFSRVFLFLHLLFVIFVITVLTVLYCRRVNSQWNNK
jgi:hypothetical protein